MGAPNMGGMGNKKDASVSKAFQKMEEKGVSAGPEQGNDRFRTDRIAQNSQNGPQVELPDGAGGGGAPAGGGGMGGSVPNGGTQPQTQTGPDVIKAGGGAGGGGMGNQVESMVFGGMASQAQTQPQQQQTQQTQQQPQQGQPQQGQPQQAASQAPAVEELPQASQEDSPFESPEQAQQLMNQKNGQLSDMIFNGGQNGNVQQASNGAGRDNAGAEAIQLCRNFLNNVENIKQRLDEDDKVLLRRKLNFIREEANDHLFEAVCASLGIGDMATRDTEEVKNTPNRKLEQFREKIRS